MEIMFGHAVDMDRHIFRPAIVPDTPNQVEKETPLLNQVVAPKLRDPRFTQWIDDKLRQHLTIIDVAIRTQSDKDTHHIQTYSTERTEYPIGSYVLQVYETNDGQPPDKLTPSLRGPHRVISVNKDRHGVMVYSCQDLVTRTTHDFQAHYLRPFYYDPERTSPIDIARRDNNMFFVEAVLDHRNKPIRRQVAGVANMFFKIKWLGYDTETWEPWKNVRTLAILHDYLTAHDMKYLIPKKFQT
jgi:hypothetical protein